LFHFGKKLKINKFERVLRVYFALFQKRKGNYFVDKEKVINFNLRIQLFPPENNYSLTLSLGILIYPSEYF
jgi:hypothetical protein